MKRVELKQDTHLVLSERIGRCRLIRVRAGLLCLIHGVVGCVQQLFDTSSMIAEEGDADAQRHGRRDRQRHAVEG